MKNKTLIVVGGIVLVLVVFVWQVVANLDSIVAGVIEDVGSDVLKTKVSVSGVAIDLKEGKASIAGMRIANPDGFSRADLLDMEGIEIDLDLESLGKDVLVIDSIRILNPKIKLEEVAGGNTNMKTLLDNVQGGSSAQSDAVANDSAKMIIDRLEFSGGQVTATSEAKPGESKQIKLPAINMSGIGRPEGGVTADVVAKEVTTELVNVIVEAALKAGVNKAIEKKKKGFLDKLKGG